MMPTFKITPEMSGERLDVLLARRYPDYSRAFLQKWVKAGHVTCEGKPTETRSKVKAGDVFDVKDFASELTPISSAKGEVGKLKILFEDEELLVIDKPAGLVAHPAPSHHGETLVGWLRAYLGPTRVQKFLDPDRLGLVHRLDKDTTGVVIVAKTPLAQTALARQFQNREVQKIYHAIVEGVPKSEKGIISAPIGRSEKNRARMIVSGAGRPSETTFSVLESLQEVSLMQLLPKTGRTHQIRVHCAAIGHPIVGDTAYGAKARWAEEFGVRRPLLHAESLEFKHPKTGKTLKMKAPRPSDFRAALTSFKKAFSLLAITLLFSGVMYAQEGRAVKKKTAAKPAASADSGSVKQLKAQNNELQLQINGLTEQLGQLAGALEQLNLATRLRDIEKSVTDLNSRATAISNVAEESKTQGLEAVRRLKSMQDSLDNLRDQFDRLSRDMIQLRAQREGAASVVNEGVTK